MYPPGLVTIVPPASAKQQQPEHRRTRLLSQTLPGRAEASGTSTGVAGALPSSSSAGEVGFIGLPRSELQDMAELGLGKYKRYRQYCVQYWHVLGTNSSLLYFTIDMVP
eukprot:SAG22_NODE_7695_length_716_cov_1.760130_2_plen_109_part_00